MERLEQFPAGQQASELNPADRRAPRMSRRVPIQIALRVHGEDFKYNVNTVNFSKTGLRVKTNLRLEPGQPVIALASKHSIPTGYCRVVWSNGREAGLELLH